MNLKKEVTRKLAQRQKKENKYINIKQQNKKILVLPKIFLFFRNNKKLLIQMFTLKNSYAIINLQYYNYKNGQNR